MKDTSVEGLPRVEEEVNFQTLVVVCVCCKVGTGSKSTALEKETQVLAVGVKSHPRLVCNKMSKGSIEYVASATTIHLFCLVFILCFSMRKLG